MRQLLERHVALRRRVETGVDGPQPHALAAHAVPLQRLLASDAVHACLLYTSPSPRDAHESRMP
ncbi:hypothetical protein KZ849_35385, partial [Pseudomonas aeruginosa]